LDHKQYIERYLSADADHELEAHARREAAAHVSGCEDCRRVLDSEIAMKSEVKRLATVTAPAELRNRIMAALDEVDRRSQSRVRYLRRPLALTAIAALAACLIAVTILRVQQPANPAFDAAIESFVKSEQSFASNVPSKSADELAVTYIDRFGVPMAWDFSSIGLEVAGGRIDQSSDGRPIGYSLYKGSRGSLIAVICRNDLFNFPPGGETVKGVHIYHYRGYSVAATNRYSVFCIMVTRLPTSDLAQAFSQLPS
jgi:anti-sigma factor RsiW